MFIEIEVQYELNFADGAHHDKVVVSALVYEVEGIMILYGAEASPQFPWDLTPYILSSLPTIYVDQLLHTRAYKNSYP